MFTFVMNRLNLDKHGGAWCPSVQIDSSSSGQEWIQATLPEPHVITKIATQGRFGNGFGVEYAESFWLDYTRDGITWIRWRDKNDVFVSGFLAFYLCFQMDQW